MTRTQCNNLISTANQEIARLQENNDHGQQDRRITKLQETRIGAVRKLQDIKRGA